MNMSTMYRYKLERKKEIRNKVRRNRKERQDRKERQEEKVNPMRESLTKYCF